MLAFGPKWAWIRDRALEHSGHLVLATILPLFVPKCLHDLQVWNELVCNGSWVVSPCEWGERVRRLLDLEDWSAFAESCAWFVALVDDLYGSGEGPRSVVIASGDRHFSYTASVAVGPPDARVHSVPASGGVTGVPVA